MATAVDDTYSAESGATIYGGREGPSVPNDVEANVWTPTKDGDGNILAGSWANLPLDEWCEVADTNARTGVSAALTAVGFDAATQAYANGSTSVAALDGLFDAWNGLGLDAAGGRAFSVFAGGHYDCAVNAVMHLDLNKLAWVVDAAPSDPNDTTYPWASAYKTSGNYTKYKDAEGFVSVLGDGYYDVVPDGRPASRHQYDSCVYDSTRGVVMGHRYRQWRYRLSDGELTSYLYNTSGTPWAESDASSAGLFAHYDATNDATYIAALGAGSFPFKKIAMATDTMSSLPGLPLGAAGATWCVRDRTIVMVGGAAGDTNNRGVFDLDTETWGDKGAITDWFASSPVYNDEMQPFLWVPERSKFLIQKKSDQGWYWIDPADWSMAAATFGGKTVPWKNYMGSKVFYWPERKVIFYVRGGNFNTYVMRVG